MVFDTSMKGLSWIREESPFSPSHKSDCSQWGGRSWTLDCTLSTLNPKPLNPKPQTLGPNQTQSPNRRLRLMGFSWQDKKAHFSSSLPHRLASGAVQDLGF